jgi:hypothetical protein
MSKSSFRYTKKLRTWDMQEREIPPMQGPCDSSDGGTQEHHIEVGRGSNFFNTARYAINEQCGPNVCHIAAVTSSREEEVEKADDSP